MRDPLLHDRIAVARSDADVERLWTSGPATEAARRVRRVAIAGRTACFPAFLLDWALADLERARWLAQNPKLPADWAERLVEASAPVLLDDRAPEVAHAYAHEVLDALIAEVHVRADHPVIARLAARFVAAGPRVPWRIQQNRTDTLLLFATRPRAPIFEGTDAARMAERPVAVRLLRAVAERAPLGPGALETLGAIADRAERDLIVRALLRRRETGGVGRNQILRLFAADLRRDPAGVVARTGTVLRAIARHRHTEWGAAAALLPWLRDPRAWRAAFRGLARVRPLEALQLLENARARDRRALRPEDLASCLGASCALTRERALLALARIGPSAAARITPPAAPRAPRPPRRR